MSNFLAIATVTETLKQTLDAVVKVDVTGADVTALRPDSSTANLPNPGVNLYLYQVTPNAAWRNADLPTRRSSGELVQRPQVALDLHYLLTFYGDESKLEPQRLLGSVVRTLHAQPILTRKQIQDAVAATSFLAQSDLADEVELVKFTPLSFSLEELSKLWSVFFQTVYTLSLAYQGTVVLIESEAKPQTALPVRDRNIYVMPFRQPLIEQVQSQAGVNEPIVANSTLLISGKQLRGEVTQVLIGGEEATPQEISDTRISLQLSSLPPTIKLQAGVQGIQVVQKILMGTPPLPHRGFESNVAAFVLHPSITVSVVPGTTICTTLCSADVTVNFTPNVGRTQRVVLLLNEFNPPDNRTAWAYSFNAPSNNGIAAPNQQETATITIPISKVAPASYLIRVQVDGAESLLIVDTDNTSPNFNKYIDPKVSIS